MDDHHRTVAYTSPLTSVYLVQAGILNLVATCRNCSHVSVWAIEDLIERMGPDRPMIALKARCSVCDSNRDKLLPDRT